MSILLPPLLLLLGALARAAQLPPSLKTCKQNDPDYLRCLKQATQDSIPVLTKGIPSLGMPPLDPLQFTRIAIEDTPERPVSLSLEFNNVELTGLSKGIMDAIDMTPGSYSVKAKIHTETPLTLYGSYKVDGKVLLLPVKGEGMCNITISKVAGDFDLVGAPLEQDGEVYLNVKEIKVDLYMDKLFIYLQGLFNGNQALGDSTNKFLNENSDEVVKELKPAINEALGASFKELARRLFSKVPYNSVFPPS